MLHEQKCSSEKILGFKLVSPIEINTYVAEKNGEEYNYGPPRNLKDCVITLVNLLHEQALRYHVLDDDWKLTVKIDIGKYKTTDFDLDDDGVNFLFEQGKRAVDSYINEMIESLYTNE